MIEVRGLTKRCGDVLAVDDLSFDVRPGKVTGFLGPNGVESEFETKKGLRRGSPFDLRFL